MSGLEERILTLIKDLEEEKRLADKRAKQLYLAAGGGSFISHADTPAAYAAQAGKFVKVNAVPDALVFADIAWGDVGKTGSNLTDLATRLHSSLQSIGVNDHHAQSHTLASHSTKAHSELSDAPADAHHSQAHTLASHSTKAHSELSDAPVNAHHAQIHASAHHVGGGDLVNHDSLTGFVAAEHKSLPNTIAQVLSDHNVAVHDALNINADRLDGYHAQVAVGGNTIVQRHASGYVFANYFNTTPNDVVSAVTRVCVETGNDGYIRHGTQAAIRLFIGAGSGNGLDADKLDGYHHTSFMKIAGGAFTGLVTARDHGTGLTDEVVNVCYGTGNPPTANTTTIGTLFVKYTA